LDVLLEFTNTPLNKQLDRPHVAPFFSAGQSCKIIRLPMPGAKYGLDHRSSRYFSGFAQDRMNDGVLFLGRMGSGFGAIELKTNLTIDYFYQKAGLPAGFSTEEKTYAKRSEDHTGRSCFNSYGLPCLCHGASRHF
jgi:hypothetical protein